MRKTIAYYLLLIYISAIISPALPLLADVVAHNFNQAVHISTVHMVYGAQHVENEMAAENEKSAKGGHQSPERDVENIAVHLLQSCMHLSFVHCILIADFPPFMVNKLPLWFAFQNVPPPNIFG